MAIQPFPDEWGTKNMTVAVLIPRPSEFSRRNVWLLSIFPPPDACNSGDTRTIHPTMVRYTPDMSHISTVRVPRS